MASFAARTSASPSGAPCAFDVSIACGAGVAMWVRRTISEGLRRSARASSSAAATPSTSSASATCCTCQPYASNRLPLSSVSKLTVVAPSIVIRLSS